MSTITNQKEIGGVHFIIITAQVHKHIPRLSLFLGLTQFLNLQNNSMINLNISS